MVNARITVDFGLLVLIWLVQLIIYPSFRYYSPAELAVWHPNYSNLITIIVGPLMLIQVGLVGSELVQLIDTNWLRTIGWTLIFLLGLLTGIKHPG